MNSTSHHTSTLLVTGGAGFIGANFVLQAVADGLTVINLDKLTYAGNLDTLASLQGNQRHVFVQGDIGDRDAGGASCWPSTAPTPSSTSPPNRMWTARSTARPSSCRPTWSAPWACSNAPATTGAAWKVTARDALPLPARVDRRGLRLAGRRGQVHRDRPPYAPNSPYSASKAASDHLVRAFHHTYGLPVLTTNCSNNYGPYQFPEKLIPLVIQKALAGEPLPVYGDGLNIRDWLFVGDHCSAIRRVLEAGRVGETYNVGGNAERENITVVKAICALLDAAPAAGRRPPARVADHLRQGPPRPRSPLRDRLPASCRTSWAGARRRPSRAASRRPWTGISTNQPWVQRVLDGSYRMERLGS